MSYSITLSKAVTPNFERNAFRLRLEITEVTGGIDKYLFLYRELPLVGNETEPRAVFQGVCSPFDLESAPVEAAGPEAEAPWCRWHIADVWLRSASLVDEAYTVILEELTTLINTLDVLDTPGESEEVILGDPDE
jgi:hypothetical protein